MMRWLPEGKRAAVVMSVDDVHPAPVAIEALDHVRELQRKHPALRATLFTTPDWRTIEPYPRGIGRYVPFLRERRFLVPVHPEGTYRLDRYPQFVSYLREWKGAEVAMHGLHHVRRGMRPVLEFEGRSVAECLAIIDRARSIFDDAGLTLAPGMAPPGWSAPPQLLEALAMRGVQFLASSRDLDTPVTPEALSAGSGLRGVALFAPSRVGALCHIPVNFQATSSIDRALEIVNAGGLLSIKAHLLAESGTYRALDGLTANYERHLHDVLSAVEDRMGDALWWPSMSEIAAESSC
jgi:peptidoglycan/xylan/chitin deacetylase (PgdA/CDA1 family)